MADANIVWDAVNNRGDWVLSGPTLQTGNDLETSVVISLFSDRQALDGDVIPDGTNDPRGWWADDDVPIGSRMWLLKRAKQTSQTAQSAYSYIAEALQWLIDDGVAGRIDISVQWVRKGVLGAQINIYKTDGTQLLSGRYAWVWEGIN
ncbi:phage GP46 family protein [Robbsia andropogonis]|uniref:phage GP46 family protein n=1 Tax=Robbsia andropogonis TaxID=28092 RepID=UPI003D2611FE